MPPIRKLIFVYNADSSLFAAVADYAHKIISPETYQCNLCKLTYGNMGMKNDWSEFLDSLPLSKEFLHKDELDSQYSNLSKTELPAIFAVKEGTPELLISAMDLNKQKSLSGLIAELKNKLAANQEQYG